jgi:phenylacetate-CoA ligase
MLGPSYFHHRGLIKQSKNWSADQVRDYQQRRAEPLVSRYGAEVRQKDDYRQDLARYSRWDVRLLSHTVRTGGTSGQPLRFRADTFARRQKERAYLFDIWSRVGYAPYDLRVCYRGEAHAELIRFNRLENAWLISPGATLERELVRLRDWIGTLPPFFLHVYPSSLVTFIDLVGEELFRKLPIQGVLAGSEGFPAGEQERFERDFGIRIAHWYGHSEYAVLAYCCRECHGFHFYPTYGQAELLPSDTEDCQRIVATSFNRIGTQFVRYDTGDLAVAPTGSCPADYFVRAEVIVGRSQETFVDRAGRRRALGPYLFGIHGPFWDQVRDLQVVQEEPGYLLVRFVASPAGDQDLIQHVLRRRMPMVELGFESVPVIERSLNGKRRYFVGRLKQGAPNARPPDLAGHTRREETVRRGSWRLVAALAVVLAILMMAMSLLLLGVSGARPPTIHARRRDPVVGGRMPARYYSAESHPVAVFGGSVSRSIGG